ncbi:M48 family metallopeptidase [Pseudooctadecabacter jejudonensis]|uniref:Metalloprotease LoiP n=1 Tax=Pseudooctadecabacter jejudonensis TaxID=1391910 RepID=A0A1Y5S0P5_9RHOB|nr:M48 family metallopeptidase [Pseudooctadecabacter jejudonensis]SLN28955.1 Metalloprotease LoiP precursor [Pseudooctadecabacter jejudonensis]
MTDRTIITVDGPASPAAPPRRVTGRALFFDGDTAQPVPVAIGYSDADQTLTFAHRGEGYRWPYADLRALRDQAGDQMVLRLRGDPTMRLLIDTEDDRALIRARAKRLGRFVSHVRRGKLAAWGLAAVASIALIIFVLVPVMADQLADYLPPEGEKALGDATFEQIRTALDDTGIAGLQTCENPTGLAALRKIETRLTDQMDLAAPLTVHVLDHPMINAFALPGGYVVFFRGLIEEAGTPEEIAAVFAHEIGHVVARDPTRIALRSAGSIGVLGLLLGDFAGGALVLFLAEQIIRADYTQEAEAAADTFAYNALLNADLPPSAIATLFERLTDDTHHEASAGILDHLASHPAMGDRIAAARAAEPSGATFRPLLTDTEWVALQAICD